MIVPSPVPIDPTLTPFAEDPNTLRFVARYNSYLVRFVSERPYIRLGRVLSGQFAVGYVDRLNADRVLSELAGIGVVYLPLILGPTDRQSLVAAGIAQVLVQPYLNLRGQGVLMGFVDTGIDYTNDLFRYEDGSTRIQYLWDQSISGNPPGNFAVGSEYTADQINEALSSDNPLAVVPSQDTVGHGTFSLGGRRAQRKISTFRGLPRLRAGGRQAAAGRPVCPGDAAYPRLGRNCL